MVFIGWWVQGLKVDGLEGFKFVAHDASGALVVNECPQPEIPVKKFTFLDVATKNGKIVQILGTS